ncbi:MAG TPA: gliding motility-associated C-terminal domain-containing protein [Bacteroidales bacterium]|nr:gliding motility-associated C-terminal domain-containing protein [Bacteroidales bacterium]
MKKSLLLIIFLLIFLRLNATHNRAGEITYEQIGPLTYRVTVTTFTYTLSYADRQTLNVEWGDNTTTVAPRDEEEYLPNYYRKNVYHSTHTYPGPGVYIIVVQDPNRNYGVQNIPNSVNVVFSIHTTLIVNPAMGRDRTPVLLNPPYDKAAVGHLFIHNPAAYDPDGDSLSYKLTVCSREDGRPIENYTYPPASNKFYVDSISGDLVWDTPVDTGKFNVAMEIQEWRNKKKIGVVERDMQIEVYRTKNNPPVNGPLRNYCVEVGDSVDFLVTATDKDNDHIALKVQSGVFLFSGTCGASFTKVDSVRGFASSHFKWKPCWESVRNQPYDVIVKSEDDNPDLKLFDIDYFRIKVLGPSPVLKTVNPEGKFMKLTWQKYPTQQISGFSIYRREDASNFKPDSCTAGIPLSSGFVKVGYIGDSTAVSYVDTDNGQGLQFGKEYTYRIVAVFSNGTESKASNEVYSTLVSGVPVIRNVSIRNTDPVNGSVFLCWKKLRTDTIPSAGPFQVNISRAAGTDGTVYQPVAKLPVVDLNDTTYVDSLLNTSTSAYIYKLELYNVTAGDTFRIGDPSFASSVFIQLSPGDRKAKFIVRRNVPWINSRYDIFRYNEITSAFDSVGSSPLLDFADTGLVNGQTYKYYVRSVGAYQQSGWPAGLINLSQIAQVVPVDNEPPCQPVLYVSTQCDSLYNTLRWVVSDSACNKDIAGFRVYYKMTTSADLELLTTISDNTVRKYRHNPGEIIAGCYAVSAFDNAGNESVKSVMICVDSCNFYEIPNVFTPNGDGFNDYLIAKTSGLVEKVDFRLFNRNGQQLFRTSEPRLNWDGTYKGKIVSPGVYFYQCDVTERRISGSELFHLSGFIHVITEKGATITPQTTKK